MPSPEFSLQLSAPDVAYLRDALAYFTAIKTAQGDTSGADALNTLREKVDTAAAVPAGDAAPTRTPHGDRAGGDVYNTISGGIGSSGNVVQCRDIGDIDLR